MGHCKNYTIGDVVTRYRVRKGENVFHPMGWDAFGLPGEIAALQAGVHPREWTLENIRIEKEQFDKLGILYDWDHEICSCDPEYYRWNQWLFLKLYERGLAYQMEAPVNWCPECRTTLANEEVLEAACERCGTGVEAKPMHQWFLKVTDYADDLLEGLDRLTGWPERIRAMQRNWIGRTEDEEGGTVTYHLRDWCISRQRYWGTPIPIVYCGTCGVIPVPETELPVPLPDMEDFAPKGQSPLATVPEFAQTVCPTCGGPARRECDTMTGFVCSSWYFLRFASPREADRPFDPAAARRWLPVTQYVGGKEHAVGHLLYARFVTRFLRAIGWVDFDEPIANLFNQGVVHKDGDKMSKSKGNAVSVDAMVEAYGADAARVFVLFAAPPDGDVEWNEAGIEGIHRFLCRV